MADHFGAIGFKAASGDALSELVRNLMVQGGDKIACSAGYYHRLRSPVGAELWVHMQHSGETQSDEADAFVAVGITPFFGGEGRAPVRIRAIRHRPGDNPFEGAFYLELGPTIALVDAVDYALVGNASTPFMAMAQIVAFAQEMITFDDETAFNTAQSNKDVKFTPRSFLASGLFQRREPSGEIEFVDPEARDFDAPSRAFLTAGVLKAEKRRNPFTGQDFIVALVNTAGGTFDLVGDETSMSDLRPGMIVQGEFWLCGRLS